MNQVREAIRVRHYSIRTEQSYTKWIRHFILFNDKKHPTEMGPTEIGRFSTYGVYLTCLLSEVNLFRTIPFNFIAPFHIYRDFTPL